MTRKARLGKRYHVPENVFALRDQYVTVAGEIASVEIETDPDPRKIDHVWITLRAAEFGRLQISLSTSSRQSRAAGFDPRMRLGIVTSVWKALPPAGVRPAAAFDYAAFEAAQPVEYSACERSALEALLVGKARRAIFAEGRGEFYIRAHIGVHQVHSRRASFAVRRDLAGRDGFLRFYYSEPDVSELLLFKFAGQP